MTFATTILNVVLPALILCIPFALEYWIRSHPGVPLEAITKVSSRLLAGILCIIPLAAEFVPQSHSFGGIFGAAMASVLLILWFKGKHTQHRRGIHLTARDRFFSSARSLGGILLIYAVYLTVVHLVGAKFSSIIGIPCGLIALYACTPVLIRVMLKTAVIQDFEVIAKIKDVFQKADVKIEKFYFIEMSKLKFHNAMVCGPTWGVGPFQRSLFITRSLFENLSAEEVHAVLLHEAAHFKLGHIQKRMGAALIAIFISFLLIAATTSLNFLVFKQSISLLVGLAFVFLIQSPFVGFIARKHEFEADLQAIKMGASASALISALVKITEMSGLKSHSKPDGLTRALFGIIHPTIDERETMLRRGYINPKNRFQPLSRYVYTFVALLSIQFSMSFLTKNSTVADKTGVQRAVAAEH